MTLKSLISTFQSALNGAGEKLSVDGDFGPKTEKASESYNLKITVEKISVKGEKPAVGTSTKAAWLDEAKKYDGKKETDSKFGAFMSSFWGKVGLPGWTSIIGSKNAWCGLAIGVFLTIGGYKVADKGASAKAWDNYGQAINFKTQGIPRGAIVRINHKGVCSSGSGNHVTFSDGDCTPDDVKSGSFNGYGGNQGDTLKVSSYPFAHICAVRWPSVDAKGAAVGLPVLPITKSNGCKGQYVPESTR